MESYFKTGFSILLMNFAVDYDENLINQFQLRGALGGSGKTKTFFHKYKSKKYFFIDVII